MARLIPQKQIEEINIFKDSISVANSVFISGSLYVSQSVNIGNSLLDKQEITGSVEITGSLSVDGNLTFKNANNRLDATASFSDVSLDTQLFAGIRPEDFVASEATIYVSSTRGSDDNDGRSPAFPLRTIKKAAQLATPGDDGRYGLPTGSLFTGYRIDVDTGTYIEDNPIELPRNTTVWGSGLRVTKIVAKNENEDLFWVNSGCYLAEMTFAGLRVYPSVDNSQKGFAIAFAPNAFITTSPYIQNCSMISNQENSFLEAYEEIPAGGGGLNVDGNRIHPDSPLASMVLDAYTQIAPNGVGCQVVGRGFIQLVSFFTNFSAYSVKVLDGGQAVLLNSNTSFGDYGMYASGSRFITGSGGNTDAFLNVQDNYSIIVNTIEKGLSAIPALVPNAANGIRVTDPNIIEQYFVSEDSSADVAEAVKSDFRLVSSIVENGNSNVPTLIAKSSTSGYSPTSVYNISGQTQYTSSVSASAEDVALVDTNFDILLDIIERGNAATASYVEISNVSHSIQISDIEQYKGLGSSATTIEKVSSGFNTIMEIISTGITTVDIVSNTSASYKVTDTTIYETDISSSQSTIDYVSSSLSIVYDILANGTASAPTIILSSSIENPTIEIQNAYELLINNIPFIQEETIVYLSSSWSEHPYNQETCKRDIGYIISGAAHDLLYGGNEESVRSGLFYYLYPSNATTSELDPTLTGIKYASGLAQNILAGKIFSDTTVENENGYDVIFQNKDFVIEETILYISSSWSGFDYNEAKCRRDTGYILDAVATDLRYDGNERSVTAGEFYYKYPSQATSTQLNQTIDAINYAKRLTEKLLNNDTFGQPSASVIGAVDLMRENRSLIQDETITFINTQYPNFDYNQTKCRRDVGYIIDNIATDLLYGGNERTEIAGLYYFLYPSIANTTQLTETLLAIEYVNGLVDEVIQSNVLPTPQVVLNVDGNIKVTTYNSVTSSISATDTEVTLVSQSFNIVEDIIRYGTDYITSTIAGNSNDYIWTTSTPLNVSGRTQITSSEVDSENLQIIQNNFGVVTDIIAGGVGATPTLVENVSSSIKVTSTTQFTNGSSVATSTEAELVSASIAIVTDIVQNGTASLPDLVQNTSASIKISGETQITSAISASIIEANKVSSSFEIVTDIVENGVSVIPTIVSNTNENIKFFNDSVQYISSSYSGSSEDVAFISSSISIVTDIITNGTGSLPTIVDYTQSLDSENAIAAYEILKNNISFIQDETIAYLSSSWSTASYDESKCRRDVGLIISGAAEDLLWGANSASVMNGYYYYLFPSQAQGAQLNQTLDGIFYASKLAQKLVQNIEFATASEERRATWDLITNNTEFIKEETIAYLSSSWSNFDYNEVTCKRDVGYILDAVKTDVYYGGNERTAKAGEFYYLYPSQATIGNDGDTGGQLNQTLDGIRYAGRIAKNIVQSIELSSPSQAVLDAKELLFENKTFIQNEVIAFISSSWSEFSYNQTTCKRDVGYILDAAITDMVYGGNERGRIAAEYYYRYPSSAIVGGVPSSTQQKDPTVDGINYTNALAQKIVLGSVFVDADSTKLSIRNSIVENKAYVQQNVIDYINDTYPTLNYNDSKCYRDIGFIIDAVVTDLVYGGNQRSIKAGTFYYLFPSEATYSQLTETINGINFGRDLVKLVVKGAKSIEDSFDVVVKIIESGSSVVTEQTIGTDSNGAPISTVGIPKNSYGDNLVTTVVGTTIPAEIELVKNTEAGIKLGNDVQITSSLSAGTDEINKVSSSFSIVTDIVKYGITPTLEVSGSSEFVTYYEVVTLEEGNYLFNKNQLSKFDNAFTESFDDGIVDPEITLKRGELYTFSVNSLNIVNADISVLKPFYIKTKRTAGTNDLYNDGITGNGTSFGTVTFIVPFDAPDTLYYVNSNNVSASGIINIVDELPLSDTQRYVTIPSLGEVEVVTNNVDNIKINNIDQYTSEYTASAVQSVAISSSFATTVDILFNGVDNLPTQIKNVEGLVKKNNIAQYTSSVDTTEGLRNTISSSFDIVLDIVENGTGSIPTIVDNTTDLIKVTSEAQYVSSTSAGSDEIQSVSSSFAIVLDILKNGVGSLPTEIENVSGSIKKTTFEQYISASSATQTEIAKVSSSVAIVTDIISNGVDSLPIVVDNTSELIKVTTTEQYTGSLSGSLEDVAAISSSISIVTDVIANGLFGLPTVTAYTASVSTPSTLAAYEIIKENIDFIQNETIAYLSSSWSTASYDEAKCRRDVGLIISGAAEDLLFNSISASVVNGYYYYLFPSQAQGAQLNQTLDGVFYASKLAQQLVQNNIFVTASSERLLTAELITNNTEFIQEETIAYLSSSWSSFDYNETTCKRDVGYILDAVKTDIVYGGNERSVKAGEFYYLYPSAATGSQLNQTLDGINYAGKLAQRVIQNIEFVTASEFVSASYDLIVNNIDFVKEETIAYLSSSWSGFSYNETTCKRDVGYILDAVATDLYYGGNERSITAGEFYYLYPSNATGSELIQNLDGINYARRLANEIIQNNQFALAPFSRTNAVDVLIENKLFIQEEVISYVSSSWSGVFYNEDKCKRDVGYILDAVATDTLYGGNERSSKAGEFYYLYPSRATNAGVPSEQNQLDSTLDGITYAKLVSDKLLQNEIFVTASTQVVEVVKLITENKPFIQAEVISYISSSWSNFEYNEASCSRDVGYILDAVATDFYYGGNERSITAGEFYYLFPSAATVSGSESPSVSAQLYPTVDGVTYAQRLTNKLVNNINLVTASLERQTTYNLLLDNKELLQNEVISFMSSSWSGFEYIEAKCRRDVGYIVDAVATDVLYGGNERSITAGEFYYLYPSEATTVQSDQTITGINHAAGLADKIVQNTLLVNPNSDLLAKYNLILDNKELVQDNVIRFVDMKYPYFTYNRVKCRRDVGFIIDAVATDLLWGGNERSIIAGDYYYRYPSEATTIQLGETTEAIRYAKGIVKQILLNTLLEVPSVKSNTENNIRFTDTTQYTGSLAISGSNLTDISSSFELVTGIITSGISSYTPSTATYNPANGDFTMTIVRHGLDVGDSIYLKPESFTFTCEMDGNRTEHKLPAAGQPAYDSRLTIKSVTSNTVTVNVGKSGPNVEFNPTNASYDPSTGDFVVTVASHSLSVGEGVVMAAESFAFTCDMDNDQSVKSYPRVGIDPFAVRSIPLTSVTDTTMTFNVGASGPNKYFTPVSASYNALTGDMILTVSESFGLGVGRSVVLENESFAFTCDMDGNTTTHSYPRSGSDPYAEKSILITSVGTTSHTPTDAPYNPTTGVVTLTIANHGFSNGDYVKVDDGALTYTCVSDNNQTEHSYPRAGYDYPSGRWLEISNVTTNTFDINVGSSSYLGEHTFVTASLNGIKRQDGTFTINVGDAGSASGSIHTFVSASANAVKHEPQSVHTFVSASNGALKHLPQSTHTFVRTQRDSVTTLPIEVKNIENLIKVTDATQTTSSLSGSGVEVGIVSASIDMINDIIRLGSDNIPFAIAKNFQTSELDTPQNLTTGRYVTASGDYEVGNELAIVTSSFAQINDVIENGLTSLPTLVLNTNNNIKVTNVTQYTSSLSGSSTETSKVSASVDIIETIVQNGVGSIPTIVQNNTNTSNLIKVGNVEQYISASGADKIQSKIVSSSFGIVIDILVNGTGSLPTIVEYTNQVDAPKTVLAYNLLKENIEFIQNETILFMSSSWSGFEYNEASCSRDVGLIVSGVAEDLIYNANSASVVNGYYYYLFPSQATGSQLDQTVTAIRYASNLAQNIVRNRTYVTASIEVSASYDLLIQNKEFIVSESISFVSSSWSDFYYNQNTCGRDVRYIVDAVATDLIYGGNERSVTAGKYYYDYPSSAIVGGVPSSTQQKDPTVTAINYVKGLVTEIVGGAVFQTASNEVEYTYDTIRTNRGFIQNEVIAFVNAKYPNLFYNEASCSRDTGFIVDAVATDLRWGGNQRSREAGRFYYLFPSKATNVQLGETTDAVTYASDLVTEIVLKNTLSIPSASLNTDNNIKVTSATQTLGTGTTDTYVLNTLSSSFGLVMDIVLNGTGSLPTISDYTQSLTDSEILEAYSLIKSNIGFIQSESIAYISSSWSEFEYNEASCSRDVGLIVSGAAEDLLFGSVSSSVVNGYYYYLFPSEATGSQLNQTLDGIRYAARLTNKIVQSVTLEYPSTEASSSWELIRNNKQFIQSESIAYISSSWSSFGYNEDTCKRDIGYILDAVATDIKYGGNERSVTAGDFYYRYPSNATTSELEPTTTGIEYAGDMAEKVIVNQLFQSPSSEGIAGNEILLRNRGFIQNEVIAYISSSWSQFEYNEASCSRDTGYIVDAVATDFLYGGNERSRTAGEYYYKFPSSATVAGSESPSVSAQLYPTIDGVRYASRIAQKLVQNIEFVTASNEVSASWNLLRDNKEFIQNEVIAYISSSWSGVTYNEDKCKRDVGYIIDAAATDLYYGGQERSVTAGSFYYLFPSRATVKGTPSEAAQLDPTIDGVRYANGLSTKVIQNVTFVEPSAEVLVGADLLIGNKRFIQLETIEYLSSSWSEFEYNEVSCSRDLGYIIDAARTDLVYGGNERSIKAGTFYYYIPSVATTEQKPQTLDGIDFAKGMAEKVILKDQLTRATFQTQQSVDYLRASKKYLQSIAISYTAGAFPDFVYNEEKCYRDTGFIVDAIATDLLYGGNERSIRAAESYYTGVYGSAAVVITEQKKETAETNRYLRTQFQRIVRNSPVEVFGSLIITTGHDFSYSGAGVTYKALPPNQGGAGVPDPDKEITELAGGRVYFTSGNELGDFRIGTGLVINQATGTLQGRTFSRSLFSLVTPFSLALEG